MDDELILIKPTMEYKNQAIEMINEVNKFDIDENIKFSGFNGLQKYRNNYSEWLDMLNNQLNKEKLPNNLVTANTFFTVRKEDNKILGVINIRHELNEYLFNYGGHIGYSILPSERHKGYAYRQLLLGLNFCKSININRVLITCADYNIASFKTIEKADGIMENIVFNPNSKIGIKRYWINNDKRMDKE